MGNETWTSFAGNRRIVTGALNEMLMATKVHLDAGGEPVLIFDDQTGRQQDYDFRGTVAEVLARVIPEPVKAGPGRPKLGVVSGEVLLLPRHWEWLNTQPAKASGTLRRLVEVAMKNHETSLKQRLDAIGSLMWSLTGNLPGFEEATRALYARNFSGFQDLIAHWPADIREYLVLLVSRLPTPETIIEGS